jgi:hypothetical protein
VIHSRAWLVAVVLLTSSACQVPTGERSGAANRNDGAAEDLATQNPEADHAPTGGGSTPPEPAPTTRDEALERGARPAVVGCLERRAGGDVAIPCP